MKLVIGIDISKNKLDVCIIQDPNSKHHEYFIVENNSKGIRSIFKKIQGYKVEKDQILFCFETTGVYGMPLCTELQKMDFRYSMIPAIEIKRAKGLVRGKSDKTDSFDIAQYAITHEHKLKETKLPEADLMKLRLLLTEREKHVKVITQFANTEENEDFLDKEICKDILKHNRKTVSLLKKQLLELEKAIMKIVNGNEQIKKQYELAQSVPGVGPQTAINLIVTTQCFSAFDNWRKYACYAGVAPFEYTSGTSIKGRTQVSHFANKKIKSLLHMAALTAKRSDAQLKAYYDRKVQEGKNGMLVINAIRCKIIGRVFATIKRETPYVDLLKYSA